MVSQVLEGATKKTEAEIPLSGDMEWVQQTLAGHPDAFGNIVEKYNAKFLGMATHILGSQAEAEDVLQDAFIETYRHLSSFQNKSRFSTWIYSIVMNHIRNRLRHNRVITWTPLVLPSESDDRRGIDLAETGPAIDVLVEQKLELESIQEAIGALPGQYRAICVLHFFDGLTLQEVAVRLNRPIGTIKAYLHRAKKMLYRRLAIQEDPILPAQCLG